MTAYLVNVIVAAATLTIITAQPEYTGVRVTNYSGFYSSR